VPKIEFEELYFSRLSVKTGFCLPVNVEVHNEAPVSLTVNLK